MDSADMDFITFVCRELNHSDPSLGFDTFEVGSVKVDPPQWPKPPPPSSSSSSMLLPTHGTGTRSDAVIREILERPWIDHSKFRKKEDLHHQVALINKNFNPIQNTESPKDTRTTTLPDKKVKNKGTDIHSLDFMTFVRTVLDPTLAYDKFDIGSVKIEPTEWPTGPRRIPSREKSETRKKDRQVLEQINKKRTEEDKTCKMKNRGSTVYCGSSTLPIEDTNTSLDEKFDESKRKLLDQYDKIKNEKNTEEDKTSKVKSKGSTVYCGSPTLPIQDTNSSLDEKFEESKRKLRDQYDKIENEKNIEDDKTCKVKSKGSTVCCSGPTLPIVDTNTSLDGKLEAAKRKLRDQYDKIENEKKKRRIQIVEFQKPQVQTKSGKPTVVKKKASLWNGLQHLSTAAAQLHRAHHVSVC